MNFKLIIFDKLSNSFDLLPQIIYTFLIKSNFV